MSAASIFIILIEIAILFSFGYMIFVGLRFFMAPKTDFQEMPKTNTKVRRKQKPYFPNTHDPLPWI